MGRDVDFLIALGFDGDLVLRGLAVRDVLFAFGFEAKLFSTELVFEDFICFRFSKLAVAGHGLSTSRIRKGQVRE